jgi:DNA adenine methylase
MRYHGGKWRIATWIIEHFPPHKIYVESFGGAASVLMQKPESMAEVYNDIDGEIVNVFRVLRDPDSAKQLTRLLDLTPFARDEFNSSYEPSNDPVEQARRTIIRSFMGHGSNGATRTNRNGWRSKRFGTFWPSNDWNNYPANLQGFVERLKNVTIENRPAQDVINRYDSETTLHYIDPPYLPETRTPGGQGSYRYEMTVDDHVALSAILNRVQGYVVLSGYDSPLYRDLYKGWQFEQKATRGERNATRVECLWISPKTADCSRQKNLDIGEGVA